MSELYSRKQMKGKKITSNLGARDKYTNTAAFSWWKLSCLSNNNKHIEGEIISNVEYGNDTNLRQHMLLPLEVQPESQREDAAMWSHAPLLTGLCNQVEVRPQIQIWKHVRKRNHEVESDDLCVFFCLPYAQNMHLQGKTRQWHKWPHYRDVVRHGLQDIREMKASPHNVNKSV